MVSNPSAIRALSLTPVKHTAARRTNTKIAPTNVGNGNVTSPAKYDAAVAAETTLVEVKSRRRRAAPSVERDLVETFRRYV